MEWTTINVNWQKHTSMYVVNNMENKNKELPLLTNYVYNFKFLLHTISHIDEGHQSYYTKASKSATRQF